MRILITNDDGVHAPGIRMLKECLSGFADVWVVAPLEERSTTGHTVTLNDTLRVVEIDQKIYGCSGYPADCVLIAKGHILKNKKIDIVISGINRGANLGQDVYYSGTVAGAREASFHKIPSIAISIACDFKKPLSDVQFYTAGHFLNKMLKGGLQSRIKQGELLNINVPDIETEKIKGTSATFPGMRNYTDDIDERIDCRGRKYFWIGGTYYGHDQSIGSDCSIVDQNRISITPYFLTSFSLNRKDYWEQEFKELNWS